MSTHAKNPVVTALKQRMLARAAPRSAHDLNNDLTIIYGQAELAQRKGDVRLQDSMEQIKLAARNASERNHLIQQLAGDDDDTEELSAGAIVTDEVQSLVALLKHRDLAFTASVQGSLPAVDRTRLRWITGAVLVAALPDAPGIRGSITLRLSRGSGGLRLDYQAKGSRAADWLTPTLACCATAADMSAHGDGWQALILLAAKL